MRYFCDALLVDGNWPGAPQYCVAPGLHESIGIGDNYGRGGNDYKENRKHQLGTMHCMTNAVGFESGVGPAPVYPDLENPAIDWNRNGQADVGLVGALIAEPGRCGVSGPPSVHRYHDISEWDIVDDGGFEHMGVREMPGMSGIGTPLCSTEEQVDCPFGYECVYGECLTVPAPEATRKAHMCLGP